MFVMKSAVLVTLAVLILFPASAGAQMAAADVNQDTFIDLKTCFIFNFKFKFVLI